MVSAASEDDLQDIMNQIQQYQGNAAPLSRSVGQDSARYSRKYLSCMSVRVRVPWFEDKELEGLFHVIS